MNLKDRVKESLENAEGNGYDLLQQLSNEQIAVDMCTCDVDLEKESPFTVARIVKEIRRYRKPRLRPICGDYWWCGTIEGEPWGMGGTILQAYINWKSSCMFRQ